MAAKKNTNKVSKHLTKTNFTWLGIVAFLQPLMDGGLIPALEQALELLKVIAGAGT